ncbi:hypothetical protein [Treponema zioleckii]|uniref:hypothetical protein n=1 Tax=Treponema zioleckii TaxID=331680 RepID=UPI00168A52BD|nr:hypothetical protein [Treponema zioleckii]
MTNNDVIKVLKDIKTYANRDSLEALTYAIEVLEKLEKAGISEPLQSDFSKVVK